MKQQLENAGRTVLRSQGERDVTFFGCSLRQHCPSILGSSERRSGR
jgi:hypothetical protein